MSQYDADRQYLQLLVTHHEGAVASRELSTADERDPRPGEPVAAAGNTGRMRMVASGSYEDGQDDLQITAERGGFGNGASRIVWSEDGGTTHGWDPPSHVAYTGAIQMATAASLTYDLGTFDILEVDDGTLICVRGNNAGEAVEALSLRARAATDDDWSSVGAITLEGSSSTYYPSGYAACPSLCRASDGGALLFVQRHQPAGSASAKSRIDVYRAPPGSSWAANPFSLWAPDAAVEFGPSLTLSSSIAGAPMRVASGGGQVLLLVADGTYLYQLVSADDGATLDLVAQHDSMSPRTAVAYVGDFFVVAHYDTSGATDKLVVRRLGDASVTLSAAAAVTVIESSDEVQLEVTTPPVLIADELGRLALYAQITTLDGGGPPAPLSTALKVWVSDDVGLTWTAASSAAVVWDTAAEGIVPWLAGRWWKGRAVLGFCSSNTFTSGGADYSTSILSVDLGGWTNWALPPETLRPFERVPWDHSWCPAEDPNEASGFVVSTTGTPTETFGATPPRFEATCGAGDVWSMEADLSASAYDRRALRCRVLLDSDTQANINMASASYDISVRVTPTAVTVVDNISASSVGTLSAVGPHDLVVVLDEDNGEVIVRRAAHDPGPRSYVSVSTSSLTAGSPAALLIEVRAGNSKDVSLRGFQWAEDGPAYDYTPATAYGRPLGGRPVYTTNGVYVRGERGPCAMGDAWTVSKTSDWGIARAAYSADHSSPRRRFESETVTAGDYVAWSLESSSASTVLWEQLQNLWAAMGECNAQRVRLDFMIAGGTWSTGPLVKEELDGLNLIVAATSSPDQDNRTCYVGAGGGGVSGYYVEEDELVGGTVYDSSSGTTARIVRNTSGVLLGGAPTAKGAVITLDRAIDASVTAFDELWWPRFAAVLPWADLPTRCRAFRLVFLGPGPATAPDQPGAAEADWVSRWRMKALVGPAYAMALSHGKDSRRRWTPQSVSSRSTDGVRSKIRQAPTEEVVTVTWQATLDAWLYQGRGVTSPDYLAEASGAAIASRGETGSVIRGLVERLAPDGIPVGYIPRYAVQDGRELLDRLRCKGAVVATIEGGSWEIEHAGSGDEYVDEAVRGGSLQLLVLT